MPAYQFFDTAAFRTVSNPNASWASVYGGSGGLTGGGIAEFVETDFSGGSYRATQLFLTFATASIPDSETIVSATLSLYNDTITGTPTCEVYSVTSPVSGTTWLTTGTVGTLLASSTGAGNTYPAYNVVPANGSNLANAVSKRASTSFGLVESRVRTQVAPVGDNFLYVTTTVGGRYPKLDVVTAEAASMLVMF